MIICNSSSEGERLEALIALGVLDTEPEQEYDDLVALAAEVCQTPLAKLSLVDRDRVWVKAICGGESREMGREASFALVPSRVPTYWRYPTRSKMRAFATVPRFRVHLM